MENKAKELIDTFNYQCRECGDIEKAKIIAEQCVIEIIKELNNVANIMQNTNHDDAWIFVNIVGDSVFKLDKVLTDLVTVSK
jgi:hypothetical protein